MTQSLMASMCCPCRWLSPGEPDFDTDPIAIGAFHAAEKGIIVVCSAGNSGPLSMTVVNVAPWILTIAATTIDRDFEVDIMLGGNKTIIKVIQKKEKTNYKTINNYKLLRNTF
ncbi:co(2)-response secreted protease [Phtheirospermum japonicum]|uniref:Co(2)-response secreted protease n=1 Tax=Phtheirospermum japonicum TaxID=374723 RepID=A0A830DK43_9LAMI|nr:co(2)-response secreted protease [Phtheirospermum japonicum]